MNNWLFFQNAGVGPMQGQANHFGRYAPEKIEYAIKRYTNETRRLYKVLDKHLSNSESGFLVGDHISIADITTIGWVDSAWWSGVDIEFPYLKQWAAMMTHRPAIQKGRHVPSEHNGKFVPKDEAEVEKKEKEAREWIMRGMSDDQKRYQ